ncbi:TetR/AcrR family transcriptional regulator [Streptococcus chenjunshii]|uniref:TetR/AcrR family transcriptional regulator n=2 Tax=Streptococcus chenjunshii TaxID=2173853 RepID=A0A372KN19_9STRE|nr:TetR/AcrR family transcriptional regulator [Streptococcus chenjunshii]RFU51557.1 TetR/AcrR family transcriptional regulator [Streptococcus chenjunshii]RFU53677.1 TetR/AcrR family transcriptional regulator [Streptococcus chenjunshii]
MMTLNSHSLQHFTPSDTQMSLYRAYLDLWIKVGPNKIRVSHLCHKAPAARSTFYIYYETIDDLKDELENYILALLVDKNQKAFEKEITSSKDIVFVASTLAFVKEHEKVFQAFVLSEPNLMFIEKWKSACQRHFQLLLKNDNKEFLDFQLEVLSAAVVSAITYFLKHPDSQIDEQTINQLVFKLLD